MKQALELASEAGDLRRDDEARALWSEVYEQLSTGRPGLLGCVTGRAEAQVTRLSCLYALLDCSTVVQSAHLRAALALWAYVEESARYIFGQSLGDPVADEILRALREAHPEGLTTTQIHELFSKNEKASRIHEVLTSLSGAGLIRSEKDAASAERKGRPKQVWKLSAQCESSLSDEENEINGETSDVDEVTSTPEEEDADIFDDVEEVLGYGFR